MSRGIILFAHGARDPRWAEPFRQIHKTLENALPKDHVRLAFLELMTPQLPETVSELVHKGCHNLWIVPLFMAQGGHLREDLPRIVNDLKLHYPQVQIQQTSAIGDVPQLLEAIAQWILNTVQ